MKLNNKNVWGFCLLLSLGGLVGIMAYYIVNPDFASKFLTINGTITPLRLKALNNIRNLSLWSGFVFIFFALIHFFLLKMPENLYIHSLNLQLNKILNFNLSDAIKTKWNSISVSDKRVFFISLLVALLCHGFILNNIIINWDGQGELSFSRLVPIPSGRWFMAFLGLFSEYTLQPFPFMVVSLVCLSWAGLILADLLNCQTTLHKIIISAILITFPAFAVGFSFNWSCFVYPLSSVFTIYAIKLSLRRQVHSLVLSIMLFVLMLGTYQGFIAFAYAFMLVLLIHYAFEKKDKIPFVIKRFLTLGLLSPIIYKFISDFVLWALNMEYAAYRGANQISIKYILVHFPRNFLLTYQAFINFFRGVYFSMPAYILLSLCLLFFLAFLIFVGKLFTQNTSWLYKFLTILLIFLSPPFIFATQFLNTDIDSLLIFGMIPIISSIFYFVLKNTDKLLSSIVYIFIFVVLLGFINRNNIIHLKNHLWTQTSLHLTADVALRISSLPEFSPEMKIARYGNLSTNKFPLNTHPPFDEKASSMNLPTGLGTYAESFSMNGMMNYLGLNFNPIYFKDLPIEVIEQVKKMPIYPEEGSVRAFGNYIVVKFSEM